MKIVKNPRMNNIGQFVLSFDQNLLRMLENTTLIKQFRPMKKIDQNFVKGQYGTNHFVLDLKVHEMLRQDR